MAGSEPVHQMLKRASPRTEARPGNARAGARCERVVIGGESVR
jgi:hypothetical protein